VVAIKIISPRAAGGWQRACKSRNGLLSLGR
jgi:hypothetical protein